MAQDPVKLRLLHDTLANAPDDTSRINALRKIGGLFYGVMPDSNIFYHHRALALSEKIKWTKGMAQACLNLGSGMSFIGNYDSAIYFSTKALAPAKLVGDKNRIALIYINRGTAYTETQQYVKAMADIEIAKKLSEETGDKDRQARVAQSMCEIYMYQSNYTAAIPWAEKALQLTRETGNEAMQSVAEMSLGGLYSLDSNFKKSEPLLKDAIQKAKENNRPDIIIEAAMSLSSVYLQTKRYQQAAEISLQGVAIAKSLQLNDRLSSLQINLGKAYYKMEQYNKALNAHLQGYEIVKGKKEFQKSQYENLEAASVDYAALREYNKAYEAAVLAADIKDSALKKDLDETMLKLQTQVETQEKEKQIALLKKDQQLNKLKQQKSETFQFATIIILVLLVIISFIIINRYRVIQRIKRKVEVEQVRNNIARSLHDDIGSTLTSINILSKVALQQAETNVSSTHNIQKIKDHSLSIMESMGDIVWAVNPVNDSLDKIIIRIKEFAGELCEQSGINFLCNEEGDTSKVNLTLKQRSDLYLICKEAINNSVKYSNASTIEVFIKKELSNLRISINDNGKGFNTLEIFNGNGLKNMNKRAEEINAVYNIYSAPVSGTRITLDIAIT